MDKALVLECCPKCRRVPSVWQEKPRFGSRMLWWIGCKLDGHLVGANTYPIARYNWSRYVLRFKTPAPPW